MFKKLKPSRPSWPYLSLLTGFIVIFLWKTSGIFWIPAFSGHLSNFALSGILLLVLVGPGSFENIKAQNKVFVISLFLAFANIIVESFNIGNIFTSSIFNIADLTDALFGIIAILIVVIVYWLRVSKRQAKS